MGLAVLVWALALAPPAAPEKPPVQRPQGLRPKAEDPPPSPEPQPPAEASPEQPPQEPEPDAEPTDPSTTPTQPEPTPAPAQPPVPQPPAPTTVPETPLDKDEPETPLERPPSPPPKPAASDAERKPPTDYAEEERKRERGLNDKARAQWKLDNRGAGRLGYTAFFSPLAYIPGPPIVAGVLHGFVGGQFAPKFRKGKVHRTRALGYWGQLGGGLGPGVVIHRHNLSLAGTGGPKRAMFYQVGGGVVHYVCCRENSWGGTVGAAGAWRRPIAGRSFAFVLGVPILIDVQFDSDVRGSIGVIVGLTNL